MTDQEKTDYLKEIARQTVEQENTIKDFIKNNEGEVVFDIQISAGGTSIPSRISIKTPSSPDEIKMYFKKLSSDWIDHFFRNRPTMASES